MIVHFVPAFRHSDQRFIPFCSWFTLWELIGFLLAE